MPAKIGRNPAAEPRFERDPLSEAGASLFVGSCFRAVAQEETFFKLRIGMQVRFTIKQSLGPGEQIMHAAAGKEFAQVAIRMVDRSCRDPSPTYTCLRDLPAHLLELIYKPLNKFPSPDLPPLLGSRLTEKDCTTKSRSARDHPLRRPSSISQLFG